MILRLVHEYVNFLNKKEYKVFIYHLLKLEDAYVSDNYRRSTGSTLSDMIDSSIKRHHPYHIHEADAFWYYYTLNIIIKLDYKSCSGDSYKFKFVWRIPFDGGIPKVYRCFTYDYIMRKESNRRSISEVYYMDAYDYYETLLKTSLSYMSRYDNIDYGFHPNNPQVSEQTLAIYIDQLNPRF